VSPTALDEPPGSGERRSVDFDGLIEEALNLAYHGGRTQGQSFNVTLDRDYAGAIALIEIVPWCAGLARFFGQCRRFDRRKRNGMERRKVDACF
jgi:hypothetical protein